VDATSLIVLDAMITQLLNYKDQVCKRIELILRESSDIYDPDNKKPNAQRIIQVRRYDVFPVKRLNSREDVDGYLEAVRKKLYDILEADSGIQIS